MKERHLFTLLSVEAAACVLFCILQRSLSGLFSTLIAFPFEQIGAGLRILSLSGAVGNVIAIILYMLLGLIPAGIWGFLHWRKKSEPLEVPSSPSFWVTCLFAFCFIIRMQERRDCKRGFGSFLAL